MKSNNRLKKIVKEEITKAEVTSIVNNKIDSRLSSTDFDKKIKEITASVIGELFKTLWQNNSYWKNNIKR